MTSAAGIPNASLNDDNTMPVLGIGVGELSEDEAERAVSAALEIGIRSIDTAAAYGNEAAVGRAIAASGIPRAEIFLTTKLATPDQGYQASQDALAASLERLGQEYVDLYLIHWPAGNPSKYVDSWGGLMKQKELGNAKSIGVANFTAEDVSTVIDLAFFVPAVNQIEVHPYFTNEEVRAYGSEHGILTEAWSPIAQGKVLDDEVINQIAESVGKAAAQVVLRWHVQRNDIVFPKSVHAERIKSNFEIFDFDLSEDEMTAITALNRDESGRNGPHPDEFDYIPD